jgi:hypothetical protein
MKFLAPLLFILGVSATANAQNCEKFADPARRAECYAHYGQGNNHYNPPPVYHHPPKKPPGGHYYPPPVHHYPPPVHHYPPPPPHYGYNVTGPQRTVAWDDRGVNHIPKLLSESMTIHVGGRLVNELLIRALGNRVQIESISARLVDGRYIDLSQFRGTMHDNTERRSTIDRYNSLRVDHIEIRATSPNLFGSRGKMQIVLGLAD